MTTQSWPFKISMLFWLLFCSFVIRLFCFWKKKKISLSGINSTIWLTMTPLKNTKNKVVWLWLFWAACWNNLMCKIQFTFCHCQVKPCMSTLGDFNAVRSWMVKGSSMSLNIFSIPKNSNSSSNHQKTFSANYWNVYIWEIESQVPFMKCKYSSVVLKALLRPSNTAGCPVYRFMD